MELHHRVELIDTLMAEAEQKMQALQHALAAHERAREARSHASHDTPAPPDAATLKYEQALWERACQSLTELRTILEDLEESERQRGLSQ
jgi:hypothetical protein